MVYSPKQLEWLETELDDYSRERGTTALAPKHFIEDTLPKRVVKYRDEKGVIRIKEICDAPNAIETVYYDTGFPGDDASVPIPSCDFIASIGDGSDSFWKYALLESRVPLYRNLPFIMKALSDSIPFEPVKIEYAKQSLFDWKGVSSIKTVLPVPFNTKEAK